MAAAASGKKEKTTHKDIFDGFDLEKYISQYREEQQVPRLLAIMKHSSSNSILTQAAYSAYNRLKGSYNTVQFRDLATKLFAKGFTDCTIDDAAVAERDREASRQLEKLQTGLGNAQNNLVKDDIRKALNELSDFYYSRGDLQNAMKMVNRSREACTTDAHIFTMCTNAIRYNLSVPNFAAISQYHSKADQVVERLGAEEFVMSRVTTAVVQLDKRMYKSAAMTLLGLRKDRSTPAEFGAAQIFFPPGDLCLVATLCALATFDRTDLEKFVSNPDLKVLFETEPELNTLAKSFYDCEYAKALAALDTLLPRIRLDYFLQPHAHQLISNIRTAAMKQYTYPFATLNLVQMAEAFNMPLEDLRKDLSSLIQKGTIRARIDMANDVLYATSTDNKAKAFDKAIELADDFLQDSEQLFRLLSMQRNDVMIKANLRGGRGGGGDAAVHMGPPGAFAGAGAN